MIPLQFVVLSALTLGGQPNGIVLDFSATWCGPCQEMSPIVSKLEREGHPIKKVDIDQQRELAQRHKVTMLPTFLLIVEGKEVSRVVGRTSEANLRQMIAKIPQKPDEFCATDPPRGTSAAKPRQAHTPPPRRAPSRNQQVTLGEAEEQPEPAAYQPPKRRPETLVRAKLGDQPLTDQQPLATGPLAASARIRVKDSKGENFGSGTIINSQIGQSIVLTCGHIFRNLDKSSTIEVDLFNTGHSETYVGKVVGFNLNADVGLISIPTDAPVPVCHVAPAGTRILKGTPVITVGCGGGEEPTIQHQRVTALNRYLGPDNLECTGVPVQGRSGGGLFTNEGLVIGVCTAADQRDKRGLYAGLKAVQDLLERKQLAHLYRTGAEGQPMLADRVEALPETRLQPTAARTTHAAADESLAAVSINKTVAPAVAAGLDEESALAHEAVREALQGLDHAEVVCVIRPIDQPRAASRVVVINRASPRFVSYLTDELAAQDDVQATMLTQSKGKAVANAAHSLHTQPAYQANRVEYTPENVVTTPAVYREAQRPALAQATTTASFNPFVDEEPAGPPRPYRRIRR